MNILVQKFGGSSMATPALRAQVIEHIKEAEAAGYRVVVVVSAMGRAGEPYATDTLLQLVDYGKGMDPRDVDLLLSCGEVISASVLVCELVKAGQRAAVLTGGQAGILTDDAHGSARIIEVRPDRVLQYLSRGIIPVVAGFQGRTRDGDITTLGRGSSDTSAVALGVALRAEMVEIYTDVDGVMTADPRVEPNARRLDTVTYREIAEMAHLGAKVIHPRAVEIAMEGHIPLRIRATGSKSPGTLVQGAASQVEIRSDRVVTGIAHVGGMVQIQLETAADFNRSDLGLAIFQGLANAGISLDMIYVSPNRIAFIIEHRWAKQAEDVLRSFPVKVQVQPGMAKVSAVGAGMRGVPGVMARVVFALQQAGVTIYQTTDSHANISCLVREKDVEAAVHALHTEFQLGEGQT
ncbi:MAG TPA: aspartate kinase [Firmicutes bacterium]|nr:aspartate kinase [Bacillota bacterium]